MAEWLRLEDLRFAYGTRRVFDGLSLFVPDDGPVTVLVGRTGVGKTTLVSLIAGLLRPEAGRILVNGKPVSGPAPSRPVVFQNYNLFPWMSVQDNVAFGLKCQGVPTSERYRRARELLARMRLEGTEDLLPTMLSGGMKQRVGLARALAVEPDCVLMDEPLSAVDSATKDALLAELTRLAAEGRPRFLLVTHDLADAVFLGDRVLLLRDGTTVVSHRVEAPSHPRPPEFRYAPAFRNQIRQFRASLESERPPGDARLARVAEGGLG